MTYRFDNLLVAVDGSDVSASALQWAIDFAKGRPAVLRLLHVYTPTLSGLVPDGVLIASVESAVHLADAAQRRLDALVSAHRDDGVRIEKLLREGIAHEEILAEAEKTSADLIVMGTHGRTGIAHAILGSTAELVVRAAKVPVVTIRGA
ncbi:MAG: universal stress protein [Polyangiales bacterium]